MSAPRLPRTCVPAGPVAAQVAVAIFAPWSHSVLPALVLCAVSMCCSTQGMDTLMVMKMGQLLRVPPRAILCGQLLGSFASIPIGLCSYYLFTGLYVIPSANFQAPLADVFRGLADLFLNPAHVLPDHCMWFIGALSLYAAVFHAASAFEPSRRVVEGLMLPVPFAVALGLYIPPFVSLDFALGACARWAWRTHDPEGFDKKYSAVAAGMISGEGFAAVVAALAEFGGATPLLLVPGRCA